MEVEVEVNEVEWRWRWMEWRWREWRWRREWSAGGGSGVEVEGVVEGRWRREH